nr:hypothetical protein [Kitasatospora aureofaciens]
MKIECVDLLVQAEETDLAGVQVRPGVVSGQDKKPSASVVGVEDVETAALAHHE